MDFEKIVSSRFACKKFDGKKIPEKKVLQLLEFVRLSPSSYNLQPWKIKIVSDLETKQKLAAFSGNNSVQLTTCSHLLVFCAETDSNGLLKRFEQLLKKNNWSVDQIQATIEKRRLFLSGKTDSEQLHWAQLQVYLALGNALNGSKELGFASCPIGSFEPEAYSRILQLPSHLVPTIVLPIGFPADSPKPKTRFSREEIVF
jgi:nitroreductase